MFQPQLLFYVLLFIVELKRLQKVEIDAQMAVQTACSQTLKHKKRLIVFIQSLNVKPWTLQKHHYEA